MPSTENFTTVSNSSTDARHLEAIFLNGLFFERENAFIATVTCIYNGIWEGRIQRNSCPC